MSSNVWRSMLAVAVGVLAIAMVGAATSQPSEGGIEGTYRLVSRDLPDGTMVRSPEIFGLMTYSHGYRNFNIYWKEGDKAFSIGMASEYKLADETYSETDLYYAVNDEIGGKGMSYDLSRRVGSSPVTRDHGRLSFQMPLHDEPAVVFDRNGFTATREGAFVDHWERVK
jgi:hypothetical protein